ncbi:MAG: hypothetical protein FP826_11515, partial [Sphingomonadales bacterium]|nr:hypothetical protein [Sphingomonadales bacterium]MBU3992565.1 hypothetical protein [Alphaproteobacteria bacterium]
MMAFIARITAARQLHTFDPFDETQPTRFDFSSFAATPAGSAIANGLAATANASETALLALARAGGSIAAIVSGGHANPRAGCNPSDRLAPDAPLALDLAAADDNGASNSDNVTSLTGALTISGLAEARSTVELFAGGVSLGTTLVAANGTFSLDVSLPQGENTITAVATDCAGNVGAASEGLTINVVAAGTLVNSSIDADGGVVTLYFNAAIEGTPDASAFAVMQGAAVAVSEVTVVGNRIYLQLATPLAEAGAVTVAFDGSGVFTTEGAPTSAFAATEITNRLDLDESGLITFTNSETETLAGGAEIATFDPLSGRIFVTGSDGVQVLKLNPDLSMSLIGTIAVGTNQITSVAVANGIVAVAVVADTKTDNGSVYFLDAAADIGPGMILGSVEVGALPDMVTFTPDGTKVLVANEAEPSDVGTVPYVNPEGSVSVIDISGGIGAATVQTAGFAAFNDQVDALKDMGVRLLAGEPGFEDWTVAQDVEPEYIAVSPDGTTAMITLQEANAVAILDIATATILSIAPLGLKSFDGLLADFSDRDSGIQLDTDNPVFGMFMPDSIGSFAGADGQTYYVIANEGDDREDFIDPSDAERLKDLTLDPVAFPDAGTL